MFNWELCVGFLDGLNVFSAFVIENIFGALIFGGNNNWVIWTLVVLLVFNVNIVYVYDVYFNGGGYISFG